MMVMMIVMWQYHDSDDSDAQGHGRDDSDVVTVACMW